MQKLQEVLNDKESMQQIQELASMLTSGGDALPDAQPADNTTTASTANGASTASSALSAMSALTGGGGAPPFDIGKLMQMQSVMSAAAKPDKNIALLQALRPLLKEENQVKLDRIIKMFRLMAVLPLLKESGLLGGDLFG